jgi:hypothetical protein
VRVLAGASACLLAACASVSAPTGAASPGVAPAATAPAASAPAASAPAGSAPAAEVPPSTTDIRSLAWLAGCWRGSVNQRLFREHWLPQAGGMMVGAGQVVMQGRTQDYQYLRIEPRSDGLWYVIVTPGAPEAAFHLASAQRDEANDLTVFTFERSGSAYPQRIVYRRGIDGWLYASAEGSVAGKPRDVIYPMRRVDCETDELIRH